MKWGKARGIGVLLAAVALIPILVLGGLARFVLNQDREMERQRRRDLLEVAVEKFALDLERKFQSLEESLGRDTGIRFTASGFEVVGGFVPLYQPLSTRSDLRRLTAATPFDSIEVLENQQRDFAAAADGYRALTKSADLAIRGEALARLGRVLRKSGSSGRMAALDAYRELEGLGRLGAVTVFETPPGLLARQGRGKVFEESGARNDLLREGSSLAQALYSGQWPIDRATFESYRDMAVRWGAAPPSDDAVAQTEAAIHLWGEWRSGKFAARDRKLLREGSIPVLAVWSSGGAGTGPPVVWLATPGSLADLLNPLADARQLTIALSDVEGGSVFGAAQSGALPVMPDATHLPFIVRAAPAPDFASAWRDSDRLRRSLLVAGLVGAFALMVAAALALYRVTMRRLRLARQESDFVSAVSHEFRTPLTSMRHLTDLLRSGSIADSERRSQYYGLLGRETERLHRMVESLLSLGRIDAGAYVWRLESSDAGDLARAAVDEFRNEPQAVGREIVCEVESPLRPIHVDREALNRALWNLLENASKYSKPGTPIRVSVRRSADAVTVDVADAGIGIPAAERSLIFQKFVRGAEAKRAGIRGVGVGLALVQRIVEAHGGSVRLESELGRGSTFTLVFPCPES